MRGKNRVNELGQDYQHLPRGGNHFAPGRASVTAKILRSVEIDLIPLNPMPLGFGQSCDRRCWWRHSCCCHGCDVRIPQSGCRDTECPSLLRRPEAFQSCHHGVIFREGSRVNRRIGLFLAKESQYSSRSYGPLGRLFIIRSRRISVRPSNTSHIRNAQTPRRVRQPLKRFWTVGALASGKMKAGILNLVHSTDQQVRHDVVSRATRGIRAG